MRLQKFMAEAGVASRRKSEELIEAGSVTVNGERATIGMSVDEDKDVVEVRGKRIGLPRQHVYLMLNKPSDCVCTCADDKGRKTILDYLPKDLPRVFPVGRLDFATEGLLILTNDGELANGLTHPSHEVEKKYLAVVDGPVSDLDVRRLSSGVTIDGHKTAPAVFKVLKNGPERSEVLCVIREGRNRQIRRMFEVVGRRVLYMKRVAEGELRLGALKRGQHRRLTAQEVDGLRRSCGLRAR